MAATANHDHGELPLTRPTTRNSSFRGRGEVQSFACKARIAIETGDTMGKYPITAKRSAPPQGAYSQGWRAGDFIFVCGTGPLDPATGKLVGLTIEEQTSQ